MLRKCKFNPFCLICAEENDLGSFGKCFIYANMHCTHVVNNSLTFQGNQTQSSPKHLTVVFEKLNVVHAFVLSAQNVAAIHLTVFYITCTDTWARGENKIIKSVEDRILGP